MELTELVFNSCITELQKIARSEEPKKKKGLVDRALRAGPGVGAVVGGVLGAAYSKRLKPSHLIKTLKPGSVGHAAAGALLGAGMGASTGWIPQTLNEAQKSVRGKD